MMHDIFSFLKRACGGMYHFAAGQVYCRNEMMMAGSPSPIQSLIPADFNVPRDELEKLLSRIAEPEASFDGESLLIRGGRLRGAIQVDRESPPPLPDVDAGGCPCPEGLVNALEMARCFTEDGARWTAGIRLMDGRVTAICNTGGIDVLVPGLTIGAPILITEPTAAFLCAFPPGVIQTTDAALHALWDDGRWLRAQLLAAEMPSAVEGLFDNAKGPAATTFDDEWRAAFEDAAALTDGPVELHAGGFRFARGVGRGDASFATGLAEDHRSVWNAKVLEPVVRYAARWNPAGYPDPVRFEGEGFRGIVMGRR